MVRRTFFCHQRPAGATVAAVVLAASVFLPVQAQGASPSVGSIAQADAPVGGAPSTQGDAQAAFEQQLEQRDFGTFSIYKRLPQQSRDEVFRSYTQGASSDEIKASVKDAFFRRK
jgi:hypothetical protein